MTGVQLVSAVRDPAGPRARVQGETSGRRATGPGDVERTDDPGAAGRDNRRCGLALPGGRVRGRERPRSQRAGRTGSPDEQAAAARRKGGLRSPHSPTEHSSSSRASSLPGSTTRSSTSAVGPGSSPRFGASRSKRAGTSTSSPRARSSRSPRARSPPVSGTESQRCRGASPHASSRRVCSGDPTIPRRRSRRFAPLRKPSTEAVPRTELNRHRVSLQTNVGDHRRLRSGATLESRAGAASPSSTADGLASPSRCS